jgi:hypothetical protein
MGVVLMKNPRESERDVWDFGYPRGVPPPV